MIQKFWIQVGGSFSHLIVIHLKASVSNIFKRYFLALPGIPPWGLVDYPVEKPLWGLQILSSRINIYMSMMSISSSSLSCSCLGPILAIISGVLKNLVIIFHLNSPHASEFVARWSLKSLKTCLFVCPHQAVEDRQLEIIPHFYTKTWKNWLSNIR